MYITEDQIQERAEENGWEGGRACDPSYDLVGMNDIWDKAEIELINEHQEQIFDWHTEAMSRMLKHGIHEQREEIAWMLLKGMGELHDECPVDAQGLFFREWEVTPQLNQWQFDNVEHGGSFFDVDLLEGLKCCEAIDKEHELKAGLKPAQIIQLDEIINTTKELAYSRVKKIADRSALGGN